MKKTTHPRTKSLPPESNPESYLGLTSDLKKSRENVIVTRNVQETCNSSHGISKKNTSAPVVSYSGKKSQKGNTHSEIQKSVEVLNLNIVDDTRTRRLAWFNSHKNRIQVEHLILLKYQN